MRGIRKPRPILADRHVVDQRRLVGELVDRNGRPGPGVIDVRAASKPARDEQQTMSHVDGHPDRHAPVGRVDEQLRRPTLDVASEDVAREQVAGVEDRTGALGDPLGGARTRQHDRLIGTRRRRRRGDRHERRKQDRQHHNAIPVHTVPLSRLELRRTQDRPYVATRRPATALSERREWQRAGVRTRPMATRGTSSRRHWATVDCRMPEREMGLARVARSPMEAAVMAATAVDEEVMGRHGVSDRAAPGRRGLEWAVSVAKSRLAVQRRRDAEQRPRAVRRRRERAVGGVEVLTRRHGGRLGAHPGRRQSLGCGASIGGVQGSAWTERPVARGGVELGAVCLEVGVFGRVRAVLVAGGVR